MTVFSMFSSASWTGRLNGSVRRLSLASSDDPKWSAVKKTVKTLITDNRRAFWRDYIKPLVQQGNLLKIIDLEQCDLTWRSIIYDLPRGVLSFAVRSAIDYLPTFKNLKTWGKGNHTKCKLCGNHETLLHVLNNCSTSLNQGRYTWRHNSILRHTLTTIKGLIGSENNDITIFSDLASFTTTGDTLPVNVIVSKLKPDMVIYNRHENPSILSNLQYLLKQTSTKPTTENTRSTLTLFPTLPIMGSYAI